MQGRQYTHDESSIRKPNYAENRESISFFWNTEAPLIKSIQEVFIVQNNFQQRMVKLCKAFDQLSADLPINIKGKMTGFLACYRGLSIELFPNHPMGTIKIQLKEIINTFTITNPIFKNFLDAILISIANLRQFQEIIDDIHKNPDLVTKLLTATGYKTFTEIGNCVVAPFQLAPRYELLLINIKNKLVARCSYSDAYIKELDSIKIAIDNLKQNVAKLNEFHGTVSIINETIEMLGQFLVDIASKKHIFSRKVQISLMTKISNGLNLARETKDKLLNGPPDFMNFCEKIDPLLESIKTEYEAEYKFQKGWSNAFSSMVLTTITFMGQSTYLALSHPHFRETSPIAALNKVKMLIDKLKTPDYFILESMKFTSK